MSIIAFYTNGKDQTGNTLSAMSLATYLGITQNKKTLLISTSLNDSTVKEAFWPEPKKKTGLFGANTSVISENGIEGLDRVIRSNKISPDIITDYTKVALKGRLEILFGYKGSPEQYREIQKQYVQIVNMASKCYENVIVDIDKSLDMRTRFELNNISDVVVALTTQQVKNINDILKTMSDGVALKRANTIIALGRYDERSKYNAKNISRNVLRQKRIINTIPYNTVLSDAIQEGQIIDVFIKFLGLKIRDENVFFLEEIKRLADDIDDKITEIIQMKNI